VKANKALKRIAKIEVLTSEVTRRLSKGAPHVSAVLKDLKAAVAQAKKAVSALASVEGAKKNSAPVAKKTAKKEAVKTPKAKKRTRIKRAAKKAAPKSTASLGTAEEAAIQETTSGD
jgi:hypothetical protein